MTEAHAILENWQEALEGFDALSDALNSGVGIISEMIDPNTGSFLGNLPKGLTILLMR